MSRAVSIATYGYVAEQNVLSEPLSITIVEDNNIITSLVDDNNLSVEVDE